MAAKRAPTNACPVEVIYIVYTNILLSPTVHCGEFSHFQPICYNNFMSNHPSENNHNGKLFLFAFFLIAASIAGMVVTGILLYEKKNSKSQEEVLPASEEGLTPSDSERALSDLVSVALSTRQYTILIQNLAAIVTFEIEGENCCGKLSVSEVMQKMSALEGAQGPWTFEKEAQDRNETIMIGISSNDYLFGYIVDEKMQITKIIISKPTPITPAVPTPTTIPTPTIAPIQNEATNSAQESAIGE